MRYFNLHVTATDGSHNRDFIVPVMNKFDLKSTFIINKNMMIDESLKADIMDSLKSMIQPIEMCITHVEELTHEQYVYCYRTIETTDSENNNNYMTSRYLEAIREINVEEYLEHENLLH